MKALARTLAVLAVVTFSTTAMAGIDGTAHDLVGVGGLTEICLPCHTPHNADAAVSDAPLWNHEVTIATYTHYTTLSSRTGTVDGVSKLCLSCHDGTVAIDSYGGATGLTTIGAGGLVGLDLSNDHPIGLEYLDGTGYNLKSGLSVPLFNTGGTDRVECATCHDVHDDTISPFLRINNSANSALCTECHAK